jgi:hypothetical protein
MGRERHPQSHGGVEWSNRPFKEALLAWMMDNKEKFGVSTVCM